EFRRVLFRSEARGDDRAAQIVALDAGEVARVDDVLGARLDDHPTVVVDDIGLIRRQEGRTDVGEVGTRGQGGQDRPAVGDGAGEQQRTVEPGPDLLHE